MIKAPLSGDAPSSCASDARDIDGGIGLDDVYRADLVDALDKALASLLARKVAATILRNDGSTVQGAGQ